MYPPSIPKDVKSRAFLADNGELGILPTDCNPFLDACQVDGVRVLGWELWIVNHAWGSENWPVRAEGLWCGGIPVNGEGDPDVVGGSGDNYETQRQLTALDLETEIRPDWLPHVRVNFTLAD